MDSLVSDTAADKLLPQDIFVLVDRDRLNVKGTACSTNSRGGVLACIIGLVVFLLLFVDDWDGGLFSPFERRRRLVVGTHYLRHSGHSLSVDSFRLHHRY